MVKKIVLSPELDAATDGVHAITDRLAIHYAAAVLFPLAAREALFVPLQENKITFGLAAKLG